MPKNECEIAIIGGSGFYDFLKGGKQVKVNTPYGHPSSSIIISKVEGKNIAFLSRHGLGHKFPPHLIPYRANIYALRKLGVKRIIAPTASGSLKAKIKPGDFVLCSSFADRTNGRLDTFYEGNNKTNNVVKNQLVHVSPINSYCPHLSSLAAISAKKIKIKLHTNESVVVINGPRFASAPESLEFQKNGYGVINMTQYPEVILAKELSMCYLNISLITDYDARLKGNPKIKPVSANKVMVLFNRNLGKFKNLVLQIISQDTSKFLCDCQNSLEDAVLR